MSFQDLVDDFSWPKVPVFKWPLTQKDEGNNTETRTIYRYGLYEIITIGVYVFLFDIGAERFGIIFDNKFPPR